MNFLASLLAKVITIVGPIFFDWAVAGAKLLAQYKKARKEKAQKRSEADAALERESQAVTPEEQENAFKDSISHTNKP